MKFPRLLAGLVVTVVVAAVLIFGVFPTRAYLDQRKELATSARRVHVLESSTAALQKRVDQLHRDDEVQRLAREQHSLILPGEEAFALLPAPAVKPGADDQPRPLTVAEPTPPASLWQHIKDRLNFWD